MKKFKIMIVEDESIAALDVKNILEELGYLSTETISTAEEALEKINDLNPDLVLMDITLDGMMSGIEAANYIQNKLSIPVIFLTAHANISTMNEAEMLNPYGYLIKPVTQNDLELTISSALQRKLIEEKKRKNI